MATSSRLPPAARRDEKLNSSSAEPLYAQLAARLDEAISSGRLKSGDQVPSEAALMETYGISRVTVRQALQQLIRNGKLVAKRGKGTFVARAPLQQDLASFQGFKEALRSQGIEPDTELLEFSSGTSRGSTDLASALNLPVRLRRKYLVDGEAFAIVEAYLPAEAAAAGESRASELAVYDILQQVLGIQISRADVGIQCARANSKVTKELGLAPRSHVLLMQRTSYSSNGTACEHMRIYIVPERYTFRMSVPGPLQIASGIQPDQGSI